MANRRYEETPGDWNYQGPQGRQWPGIREQERSDRTRHGGGYGIGGASRGYNQGGLDRSAYEEGYTHRSYDRLLDASEGRRALGKAPRGYVRSDERIREAICERLIDSPYDASDVEVVVKDREVTLTGTVTSREERRAIEELAAASRDVHDVFNRTRVAVADTPQRKLHS